MMVTPSSSIPEFSAPKDWEDWIDWLNFHLKLHQVTDKVKKWAMLLSSGGIR